MLVCFVMWGVGEGGRCDKSIPRRDLQRLGLYQDPIIVPPLTATLPNVALL